MPKRRLDPLVNRPVGTRDGAPVYVWDRLNETLRIGGSLRDASARAGLTHAALQNWLRSGARIAAAIEAGGLTEKSLDAQQRGELRVHRTVETATAEGKLLLLGLLDRLSRGAETRTVTIKVDAAGNELERTERTEQHVPDGPSIRWRLAQRFPEEWADRQRFEVTGAGGGPIEIGTAERAAELADALRHRLSAAANGSATNGAEKPR